MARQVLDGESFSVRFSDREVTAWGGLVLLKRMFHSLGFRQALGSFGLPVPRSNRGYAPGLLIEPFIVAIGCGASRFAHAETVRFDRTLKRLFGWPRVAGHRLFERFDRLSNEPVQAAAYRWLFRQLPALKRITLDLDSTVICKLASPGSRHRRLLASRRDATDLDALRPAAQARLVLRSLGQCRRTACHTRARRRLMNNLG